MNKVARKSLIDVRDQFGTEEQCLAYLEFMRWPEGVRCLKCDSDKISKFRTKGSTRTRTSRKTGETKTVTVPPRYLYECLNPECRHQFSATAGTIFNDTHLSLPQWFMAAALMVNAKKGLSAKQMERDLGVSYPTAWYLCHRIRKAMEDGAPGLLTGTRTSIRTQSKTSGVCLSAVS
ncbi:MAG: transposase [Bryobacteraceae bacterium]